MAVDSPWIVSAWYLASTSSSLKYKSRTGKAQSFLRTDSSNHFYLPVTFLTALLVQSPFLSTTMTKFILASTVAAASLAAPALARQFTVKNNCAYTVWPGLYTDLNVAQNVPDQATGWEAPAGSSVSFSVPDNWKAGRIWGRTDCDFSTNPGPTSCSTGGCNGGLECDKNTGTGVPPATVAEFTFQGDGNQDWFDVSLVDGFNIPMTITNNKDCPVPSCPADLNADCPSDLADNVNGKIVGCKSACLVDSNPTDSPNCCSGSHNTADTCPPSGVSHYDYFKGKCPDAYAYAYDESSGTALWTCDSGKTADYTITFCP
jgi:hypothetical protein